MAYLTAKQFSEKWEISERRIIKLCKEDRINGAVKNGMVWLIPENTMKPADKRNKIAKYINTQKRVMIIGINNLIGYKLIPLLQKEGYIVDGICKNKTKVDIDVTRELNIYNIEYKDLEKTYNETEKYYNGLIFLENEIALNEKEKLINAFAKKMDSEASVVLVENYRNISKLEEKLSNKLKEDIGIRINTLNLKFPDNENSIVNNNEIAINIIELLTKFKNTTGETIKTDGGYLEFDKNGRTKSLTTGEFYRAINSYFNNLKKESTLWCASTMLEDEWTEEPLEMNFRVLNLEVANRGVNVERIFIFSKNKIKEFKNNNTLKIYMQSNIKTMYVDYDEILEKEPELLKNVGNGWDGIDKSTLILDLPTENKERGYIATNKKEIGKAYKCFQKLKTYSKDLKEVLK